MLILVAYKAVLVATPAVNSKAAGGFFIGRVDQNTVRPNVLLESPESGQDYTHSGPVGLFDAHVRITARADTDQSAFLLGDAIARALQDYRGISQGCSIQMTEHFNSAPGYDDTAKVFTQTEEFTAYFTRTS
jgi:hypothetical protein